MGCDSGLDAQRQLRTRSFGVALRLCRCQSERSVRRDRRSKGHVAKACSQSVPLRRWPRQARRTEAAAVEGLRAMLPRLAARVFLYGAGLDRLDAQRQLQSKV